MSTVAELRALLVKWQVLTEEQLLAADPAGATLNEFLKTVASHPAWWAAPRTTGHEPALTDYQQRQIRKKASQPAALRRALRQKHYLILSRLGQGGMGVVSKGWDLKRSEFVALKRVRIADANVRRRLRNEFAAMTRLAKYPVVVRAIDLFKAGNSDVLVMDYQNGGDLSARLTKGPLPWRRVARWAVELLDGLVAAHTADLVHRDIKPSNVMIHRTVDRELVRLSDWGLVKDLGTEATAATNAGQILGSFHYMPPEQWSGKPEPASDLYALGCTLYHALTGRPPFGAGDPGSGNSMTALCLAHTKEPPPSVRAANPGVPKELDAVVQRMMAKLPLARGSAAELRDEFRLIIAPPAAPAMPPAPPERTEKVTGRTAATPRSTLPSRSASTPAPVTPTIAVPANRPLTPNEIQLARDAQVPLGAAAGRLLRALWVWGTQRAARDSLAGATAGELARAWRTFLVSLGVWLRSLARPASHPFRVLTVLIALALVVGLVRLIFF